ncbi:MAG TPA: hypothetical protein VJH03_08310 [Blastocatellia bacterium]|nr:hypothetical protein [Blastocatellia bacterium]
MTFRILSWVAVLAAMAVAQAGCESKAPTSGADVANANSNESPPPTALGSNANSAPGDSAATGQAAPGQEQQVGGARTREEKLPSFIDPKTGEIKDLPSFPSARRTNAMFGPIQGVQSGMLVLQTNTPIEKVAEFYEKAIKKMGWKVASALRDPEVYKWELKKGERDEALVQVKKETGGRISIVLSRLEKPPQPKQ